VIAYYSSKFLALRAANRLQTSLPPRQILACRRPLSAASEFAMRSQVNLATKGKAGEGGTEPKEALRLSREAERAR